MDSNTLHSYPSISGDDNQYQWWTPNFPEQEWGANPRERALIFAKNYIKKRFVNFQKTRKEMRSTVSQICVVLQIVTCPYVCEYNSFKID